MKSCSKHALEMKQLEMVGNGILYEQNLHVENATLPNLWQQAERKHNKLKITLASPPPPRREVEWRYLQVSLQMCILNILCVWICFPATFPMLVSSTFEIYFSSHRENIGIYTPVVWSNFRITVNQVSKIHSNYLKEAPKKCTISEKYNIFSN